LGGHTLTLPKRSRSIRRLPERRHPDEILMKTSLKSALKICFLLLLALSVQVFALTRNIPSDALKAKMKVTSGQVLNLNEKDYLMAPGCMIYNEQNMIVLTQSMPSSNTYIVRVKINSQTQVQKVWILTADEQQANVPWLGGRSFWDTIL
jgi:hypothetical protein